MGTYRNQANINDLGISIQNTKVTSQEVRDFTEYLETRNDIQGGSLKNRLRICSYSRGNCYRYFKIKRG